MVELAGTRSKRTIAADLAAVTGFTRSLEALPQRPVLVVLNYHRIGDPKHTAYDPNVFSTTASGLRAQVEMIQRRYRIVSLAEAVDALAGRRRPRGASVLLTFDDGYVDNYTEAFPVLRALGAPATFFLITSLVGTGQLPLWDRVAEAIHRSDRAEVRLGPPYDLRLDLRAPARDRAVREALRVMKSPGVDPDHFVAALIEASAAAPPIAADRVLMSWGEAAEMARDGMDFGSHTHSHQILSRLGRDGQAAELATSRRVLRERLDREITACAYPDGLAGTWNAETFSAMRETGYEIGFTFTRGFNLLPDAARFELKRTAVAPHMSLSQLRLRLALAAQGVDLGF